MGNNIYILNYNKILLNLSLRIYYCQGQWQATWSTLVSLTGGHSVHLHTWRLAAFVPYIGPEVMTFPPVAACWPVGHRTVVHKSRPRGRL